MNVEKQFLFNNDQTQQIEGLLSNLSTTQLAWLGGYLSGVSQAKTEQSEKQIKNDDDNKFGFSLIKPSRKKKTSILTQLTKIHQQNNNTDKQPLNTNTEALSVLVGSRTGNGASVAKKLKEEAERAGITVNLKDLNDYQPNKLKEEKNVAIIVSTHGEGVPPLAAEDFYDYLHGNKAPKLKDTKYSVLALGDKSYVHFCKAGRDIDSRLESLGAQRIIPRVDCDVNFEQASEEWIKHILNEFKNETTDRLALNTLNIDVNQAEPTSVYTKQNPFEAKVLTKIQLNGKGSDKETYHVELSLEGSGLTYQPGDALGVYGINSQKSIAELLSILQIKPEQLVDFKGKQQAISEVLIDKFEISTLSHEVISNYIRLIPNKELEALLADTDALQKFIYGKDVADLFLAYPAQLNAQELITLLRILHPRLYSISSSAIANPDEVHITVAAVRYNNGRYKEGICSTFLGDRINEGDSIKIYIEQNPDFRLPSNSEQDVIMVGPGTGVAPFRAFIQEREANNSKGKNWLFYGDRHFATDFLYQTEWQNWLKKGVLTQLDVAFSRDSDKKVYVQHKLLHNSSKIFEWLENGASFYVCGDMKNMWKDVHQTLLHIIEIEGKLTLEQAETYIKKLKKERRYLVDVY